MDKSTTVSMKLLIDEQGKRVLFAEAGKDFVDFLFQTLSIPMGTVISLLGKQGMVGSLANVYESVQNLNQIYIQPNKTKDSLLKPVISSPVPLLNAFKNAAAPYNGAVKVFCSTCRSQLINKDDDSTTVCQNCGFTLDECMQSVAPRDRPRKDQWFSYDDDDDDDDDDNSDDDDGRNALCPNCGNTMNFTVQYVTPPAKQESASEEEGGFVKGVVTYMVMDDLLVKPMSTISSITLLNRFNVKDVDALQEKVVHLGRTEAVKLLKASMETDKVLTNVFLNGNWTNLPRKVDEAEEKNEEEPRRRTNRRRKMEKDPTNQRRICRYPLPLAQRFKKSTLKIRTRKNRNLRRT